MYSNKYLPELNNDGKLKVSKHSTNTDKEIDISFTINLAKDADDRIVANCPNLYGIVADGIDEDEAINNIVEIIEKIKEMHSETNKKYLIDIHHI